MVEITLRYTPEELKTLICALNNAGVALASVYRSALLACAVPKEFDEMFSKMSFEEIDELSKVRMSSLRELYDYLLTFEE